MTVTVAPCFVAIFSMLLEYIVTGLIMCCFFACFIDHFLVSIFVGVLDCGWFITSLKWNDTSDDRLCVKLHGSCLSIQMVYVLGSSGCSFLLDTVAANKCIVVTSSNKWEHILLD